MNALRSSLSIAALLLVANTTLALDAPEDQTPGSPERVEEALAILPRVGTNQVAVMPTLPQVSIAIQPGLSEGEDWLKVLHETLGETIAPSTLAEGAFIIKRPGAIIQGPSDLLIFVPDQADRRAGEGPVLLMPCQTLEQLETEWTGQPIEVSGEIFTYHNRNQLLISAYRIGSSKPTNPDPIQNALPMDQSSDQSNNQEEPPSHEDDPAVRDLLNELNFDTNSEEPSPRSAHQRLEPITQIGQRSQVTTTTSVGLEEGTLILRRPSRMIRNGSGAWTIVFDNDTPNAPDSTDFIVEPCRMLMRMENIAMNTGDAGQLLVSGRVYTYKGAHYILPTLMQRVRPQEINSLQ